MHEKTAIDVVVLTIDRPVDIHECIDSVLTQDHPDVRLFVIDQGSREETAAALERRAHHEGFQFLRSERIGVAKGRNLGIRLGTAPIIVSLDNDAVLGDSGVLTRVAERFNGDTSLGAIAFAVHDYFNGGPDLSVWSFPHPSDTCFDQSFPTARFVGAGHALLREAFERVGGYDGEFFFFGEELDLSYSLVAAGYTIRYLPDISVRHKSSSEGRIDWGNGRFYFNVRNMIYLNQKHFQDSFLTLKYAGGYLLKGLLNGYAGQAWRGVRDGWKLAKTLDGPALLRGKALKYVHDHELSLRGSNWNRLKSEVIVRMKPTEKI
jgi:GT2 family glycosyltransferase